MTSDSANPEHTTAWPGQAHQNCPDQKSVVSPASTTPHSSDHQTDSTTSRRPYAAVPQPSDRFLSLVNAGRRELHETFLRGDTPELDALVGWEFRGANTPAWARLAGIKKFIKGFYRDPGTDDSDAASGYNCPVVQNRLKEPWIARPSHDNPKRFGFCSIGPVDPTGRDNAHLHALLIDYSGGHNPWLDPTSGLRDYLVAVPGGGRDLYLGRAYYALGPLRPSVSFFVLERLRRAPQSPPR